MRETANLAAGNVGPALDDEAGIRVLRTACRECEAEIGGR